MELIFISGKRNKHRFTILAKQERHEEKVATRKETVDGKVECATNKNKENNTQ